MHVGRIRRRHNIENSSSYLNNLSFNTYGVEDPGYLQNLRKEKKKFSGIYGSNESAPDYLKISDKYIREKNQNFVEKDFRIIKYLNPGEYLNSKSFVISPSSKRTFTEVANIETKKFLDNEIPKRSYEFAPKQRDFNIISNRNSKVIPPSKMTNNYFTNLIELNMFIKKQDKEKEYLKQMRDNKYKSYGNVKIDDYLERHNYV